MPLPFDREPQAPKFTEEEFQRAGGTFGAMGKQLHIVRLIRGAYATQKDSYKHEILYVDAHLHPLEKVIEESFQNGFTLDAEGRPDIEHLQAQAHVKLRAFYEDANKFIHQRDLDFESSAYARKNYNDDDRWLSEQNDRDYKKAHFPTRP